MLYKNMTQKTKTFYGVRFEPGDEHSVPGPIHDPGFVTVKGKAPIVGVKTVPKTAEVIQTPTTKPKRKNKKKYV